jgi:hypothetical protein
VRRYGTGRRVGKPFYSNLSLYSNLSNFIVLFVIVMPLATDGKPVDRSKFLNPSPFYKAMGWHLACNPCYTWYSNQLLELGNQQPSNSARTAILGEFGHHFPLHKQGDPTPSLTDEGHLCQACLVSTLGRARPRCIQTFDIGAFTHSPNAVPEMHLVIIVTAISHGSNDLVFHYSKAVNEYPYSKYKGCMCI